MASTSRAKATSTSSQPSDIYEALLAFQQDAPQLHKSAANPHFKNKYVPLDQVVERVFPKLRELGILVTQPMDGEGWGGPGLRTTLRHVPSGTEISYVVPLMLDRENPQGVGSAVTYYRRYALLSILGLIGDDDDDAETAVAPTRSRVATPSSQPATAPPVPLSL